MSPFFTKALPASPPLFSAWINVPSGPQARCSPAEGKGGTEPAPTTPPLSAASPPQLHLSHHPAEVACPRSRSGPASSVSLAAPLALPHVLAALPWSSHAFLHPPMGLHLSLWPLLPGSPGWFSPSPQASGVILGPQLFSVPRYLPTRGSIGPLSPDNSAPTLFPSVSFPLSSRPVSSCLL